MVVVSSKVWRGGVTFTWEVKLRAAGVAARAALPPPVTLAVMKTRQTPDSARKRRHCRTVTPDVPQRLRIHGDLKGGGVVAGASGATRSRPEIGRGHDGLQTLPAVTVTVCGAVARPRPLVRLNVNRPWLTWICALSMPGAHQHPHSRSIRA